MKPDLPEELLNKLRKELFAIDDQSALAEERAQRTELLQRASLLRKFDEAAYQEILKPSIPFDAFVQWAEVEPFSTLDHYYRIQGVSTESLDDTVRKTIHEVAWNHFAKRGKPHQADTVFHALEADGKTGFKSFLYTIAEADKLFDLSTALDLIAIAEASKQPLDQHQRDDLLHWSRRIHTRQRFAADYYRTRRYLQRKDIEDDFFAFLDARSSSERWIAEVSARGGSGKTMFIRWLIARHCIPEGIPCTRIDFDDIDPNQEVAHWQLLARFIQQLDIQLPFGVLSTLSHDLAQLEHDLQNPELRQEASARAEQIMENAPGMIADALVHTGNKTALLILDTTEEALLHSSTDLPEFLATFAQTHENFPGLRILIAGRNSLRDESTAHPIIGAITPLKLNEFSDDECLAYLDARNFKATKKLKKAIAKKSGGLPIKLAMLADLVEANKDLTAEHILENDQIDYVYMIERIVKRIPEPGLRWILRYGSIPQRLTKDFLTEVLAPFIERALQDELILDDPSRDQNILPEPMRGETIYRTDQSAKITPAYLKHLWQNLRRYASGSSWISTGDQSDSVIFNPEVLIPMRRAVSKQKIFPRIHAHAADHFLGRVKSGQPAPVTLRTDALYHLLHSDKKQAARFWRKQLNTIAQREDRVKFCLPLIKGEAFQGVLTKRMRAEAYFEAAWASYDSETLKNPRSQPREWYEHAKFLDPHALDKKRAAVFEHSATDGSDEKLADILEKLTRSEKLQSNDTLTAVQVAMDSLEQSDDREWDKRAERFSETLGSLKARKLDAPDLSQMSKISKHFSKRGAVDLAGNILKKINPKKTPESFDPAHIENLIETGKYRQALDLVEPFIKGDSLARSFKRRCHYYRGELAEALNTPGTHDSEDLRLIGLSHMRVCDTVSARRRFNRALPEASRTADEYLRAVFPVQRFRLKMSPGAPFSPATFKDKKTLTAITHEILFTQISNLLTEEKQLIPFSVVKEAISDEPDLDIKIPLILEYLFVAPEKDQAAAFSLFVKDLVRVRHPVTRIHLIRRMEDLPEIKVHQNELIELFPTIKSHPAFKGMDSIDWYIYLLRAADVYRVAGHSPIATTLLQRAYRQLHDPKKPWFWREFQLAWDRAAPQNPSPFDSHFDEVLAQTDDHQALKLAIVVEHAERLIHRKHTRSINSLTTLAKEALRKTEAATPFGARFYQLLVFQASENGEASEVAKFSSKAAKIWRNLGYEKLPTHDQGPEEKPTNLFDIETLQISLKRAKAGYERKLRDPEGEVEGNIFSADLPGFFDLRHHSTQNLRFLADPSDLKDFRRAAFKLIFGENQTLSKLAGDLRLESLPPEFQDLPMELMSANSSSEGLLHAPSIRYLYRSADIYKYENARLRELAALANHLIQDPIHLASKSIENSIPILLETFAQSSLEHLFENSVALKHDRLHSLDPPRIAFIETFEQLQYERQSGYATWKLALQEFANPDDFVRIDPVALSEDFTTKAPQFPEIIYLSMSFTSERDQPVLELTLSQRRKTKGSDDPFAPQNCSPHRLIEILSSWPQHSRFPGIVLDLPYREFPHEAAAQLALRNRFAAELFQAGSFPFVLATGCWGPDLMRDRLAMTIDLLRQRAPIGEIHKRLVSPTPEGAGLVRVLSDEGSVLFAHDPESCTIPVLEQ